MKTKGVEVNIRVQYMVPPLNEPKSCRESRLVVCDKVMGM